MSEDTFISHLIELRDRLIRALVALAVVTVILALWPGIGAVYDLLARPMTQALPEGTRMIATGVVSPVFVPLKVTVLAAFMIALPYVLYQMWAFVAPGLYAHEKRIALPIVVSSTLLFLLGVAYCYFVVFGLIFHAIQSFAPEAITPAPDIEAYLSFVITMFLAFGLTFEIPLLQLVLVRSGAVTVEKLKEVRGYVIVGAFVVAAVVTPPDVLSQLLLAFPMCILYQLGIYAAGFVRPRPDEADPYRADAGMETSLDKVEPDTESR
ncbi:MAG: twin-arginine translocase subunit TatC [Betaproteobacteria bacterium]